MDSEFDSLRAATADAVLRGPGTTSPELRQAVAAGDAPEALRGLVEKIRSTPWQITDADVGALRDRFSEDQLFEVVVAAAFGKADEQLRTGLRALEEL